MNHLINTNVKSNTKESAELVRICLKINKNHGCQNHACVVSGRVAVSAICNGAALRDLVTELDRAGFLD